MHNTLGADFPACKICGGATLPFDVVDFNKYCSVEEFYSFGFAGVPVSYFRCSFCEFIFTDFFDGWSEAEFSKYVYNEDYILVDGEYREIRPAQNAEVLSGRLAPFKDARILDYGSGTGVLAERMGRAGFHHMVGYDPFSHPVEPTGTFDLITCFEVIEHSTDPLRAVEHMRRFMAEGSCVLFSQTLQPPDIRTLRGNWWYAAPRNGHVSLYAEKSLAILAEKVQLSFCGRGGLYAFVLSPPSPMSRHITSELGLPLFVRRLGAPGSSAESTGWHEVEQQSFGGFRWTASQHTRWHLGQLPAYPCRLQLEIPFCMEVFPGYAAEAFVMVSGRRATPSLSNNHLTVETIVDGAADDEVALIAPEPVSPAQLRSSADHRQLGLAISLVE